jgi:Tol biopolymer transport system component
MLALALVAVVQGDAKAAFPGANGLIVFQSNRDSPFFDPRFDIYVMNADGSGQTRLTTEEGSFPAWSRNGSKIAFTSNRDGNFEIYIMNADGSGQTRLTNRPNATDLQPAWSPDGSKIAFASFESSYDIWVMNADGTGQTNLTNHPAEDTYPSWSPDGSRIAFQTTRDGDYEIYTIKPDGTGLANVTNSPQSFDGEPDWAPDGSKMAFSSNRETPGFGVDVYVMNADGTNATRLTNASHEDVTPAWSPDGTRITFKSHRDFNDEVYVMDADGANPTRLTNNAPPGNTLPEDWYPDWQPFPTDTTPPTVSCNAAPASLWPANHKLVPVHVLISTTDETNPVTVTLVSAASDQIGDVDDIQGWTAGVDDRTGMLRAERSHQERTYTLTYQAEDAVGNTASCQALVVVPKSQGH